MLKHNFTFMYVCLVLLGLALTPNWALAQTATLEGKTVAFDHPDLRSSFAAFEVYEFDALALYRLSQTAPRFEFDLALGEAHRWRLQLNYHDMRATNYREVALTARGLQVLPRRPNITFRGEQGRGREPVRFTITREYALGMIQVGEQVYFLEPLQRSLKSAPANYYLLYRAEDVLTDPSLECTFNAGRKYALPEPEPDHKPDPQGQEKMACMEVELATAGDFGMFQRYGSVAAVNDFIITVTNLMEPLYDDFNLDYLIVDQVVPTSAMADPWTLSDEAFDILDDFSAWAPGNMLTHDIGQIWVTRDIQGCGGGPDNFGLIGCAQSIGGVCGAERYNVCEDFSNSSNCLRVLSAHEIGHNWDGVHGEAGGSNIMFPTINCNATTWGAGNITRIQNHIDSRGCLTACGTLCNISVGAVISDESCPDADDGAISALIAGNMAAVTYVLSGPVNATNGTGQFTNLPPGNYTLRAIDGVYNETCFDEVELTVDPGVDNTDPVPVCVNPVVQLQASGTYDLKPEDVYNAAASNDNCGEVNLVSYNPTQVDCSDLGGPVLVTVNVNDGNGNTASCVATVTVQDNIPPVAVCFNPTVTFNGEAEIVLLPNQVWNAAASSDNCGSVSFVSAVPPAIECADLGGVVPVTVTIEDGSGNTAQCVSQVTVEGLPCGWMATPDGIGCSGGNTADYDVPTETFTLEADGCYSSNWGQDQSGHIKYELCGDGSLTARVASLSLPGWAGISMRQTDLPGARKFDLLTNLSNYVRRTVRTTPNGYAVPQQLFRPNAQWLRLVRTGNQFSGYTSTNGLNWQFAFSANIAMPNCILLGLVAYGANDLATVTATFDNVVVDPPFGMMPREGDLWWPQAAAPPTAGHTASFEVFPNPSGGPVTLVGERFNGRSATLQVLDSYGRNLRTLPLGQPEAPTVGVDLSGLPPGVYHLRLAFADGETQLQRVVIN